MSTVSSDDLAAVFLYQRISVEVPRFNSVLLHAEFILGM